ncbi:hypothetical protein E3N88_00411 [Mikania micrantha]|uniref:Uncharacterized protein n=1 Tax=Mikania micrantha TaxID=192012 RepID=A0A5N6PY25_9ASTR|nr:hypothetical protein E3N88_00411 [Mikania micrantha]
MDDHNQLALTTVGFNDRILALKGENLRLAEQVESLKEFTPRIEGSEPVSDDSDKEDEEDEEEEEDSDEEKVDYDSTYDDDDSGDEDDSAGSGSASSSSAGAPTPPTEIRTKTRHDRAAKPPQSQAEEPKEIEEVDAMPVRRILDEKLTMILDAKGIIEHPVSYDKEEGEIIHCLSKEQIAELFKLNPDEVVLDDDVVPISDLPTLEVFDDVDEVILEDLTEEESTKYTSAEEELPTFADLFGLHTEEELSRKIDEKVLKKDSVPPIPTPHTEVYRTKGYKSGGQILSWAYFHDLRCYAVMREKGIQYFRFPHDFKTLPGFEVNQLACLKMLYCEDSGMSSWFARNIQLEYRKRWVNFKPQQPERYYQPEIDDNTRRQKVILK